jgi:LmbE family N-acetylglucosaminyl deacetylase
VSRAVAACLFTLICLASSPARADILVVAPHPDDDVITSAGVMLRARQNGETVRVMYMTNGDVNGTSAGLLRQGEAVAAESILGVAEGDMIFLGYPDGGLQDLRGSFFGSGSAYTGSSGVSRTYGQRGMGGMDYHRFAFGFSADYNGTNVITDVARVLQTYQPSDIFVTSEFDVHSDHAATYRFLIDGIASVRNGNPGYNPTIHSTIVWNDFGNIDAWPAPQDPTAFNIEPPGLTSRTGLVWSQRESLEVPPAAQRTDRSTNPKWLAVNAHQSQGGANPGSYIDRFVKRDEWFFITRVADGDPLPPPPQPPPPAGGSNLAQSATATASTQAFGQEASKVADGFTDGYPANSSHEWASIEQRSGAWVELRWSSPQSIDQVVLFDRPNVDDQVISGTLTFSDGASVQVGALDNGGGALTVSFSARSVTWLRFTVNAVSGNTYNVGLAELQVFDSGGSTSPDDPPPPPNPPPPSPPGGGSNLAMSASASASTQAWGQEASKVADGFTDGYPINDAHEWSSIEQRAGAWVELRWSSPQTVDQVVLFDRPNADDQVIAGTLSFSNGASVQVGALDNGGGALAVSFSARSVTWLRFTVNAVSSNTYNVGLAELQVFNSGGQSTPTDPPPTEPVPPPATGGSNLARSATASASSESWEQGASKATDGFTDGYPTNDAHEWASLEEGAGAWLQLSWTAAQSISSVTLFDRPNSDDQVLGGTLSFSDGSSVAVGALSNGGGAVNVSFATRSVTWLRFTVSSVSANTYNVGLAELEVR